MSNFQNKLENSGGLINIKVKYLDDHVECFTMNENSLGSDLFQKIAIRMQLIESYFFGLQYVSLDSDLCWLDLRKVIKKQTDYKNELAYEICVKFYTPDPNLLHDNLTKKLFILQLKKDITNGELICSESTKILLGGLFIKFQYPESEELQLDIKEQFLIHLFNDQNLSSEFIEQCLKFHQTLKCQTINETHFDLLEIFRKIDFYGMKLHPAKDNEGLSLNLAVYHMGIVIFQKYTKINTFNWSKIRKLSFKRKRFLVKLHPEEYLELFVLWVVQGFYKDTLEFYFESRNSCKNFWKKCIEHHTFFRGHFNASSTSCLKSHQKHIFRRSFSGSRFRYIGLTQFELEQLQKETYEIDNLFQRSESAGRLASPNPSFLRLSRRNSENKYKSNHSLSVPIKPSINNSFVSENGYEEDGNYSEAGKNDHFQWERLKTVVKNTDNHCLQFGNHTAVNLTADGVENTDSTGSNEHELNFSFPDGLHKSNKYFSSASTSNETVPLSLIDVPEVNNSKDDHENIVYETVCHSIFDEYAFVPNLLAQISNSQCSKLDVFVNHHAQYQCKATSDSFNCDKSTCLPSDSTEVISYQTILQSIEKDLLFNGFMYLKELEIIFKILHEYKDKVEITCKTFKNMIFNLNEIKMATKSMLEKLEQIIQNNTISLIKPKEHIDKFLAIMNDYHFQIEHNLKCYIEEIKNFIYAFNQCEYSSDCFDKFQFENDGESETNFLRLLLSPIIQQRAHISSLSIFLLFLSSDEEEKQICQEIIVQIKETLSLVGNIEELTHIGLMMNIIKGLFNTQEIEFCQISEINPIRIGWLQKLSNKGASNRLFILLPDQLVCSKKIPSLNFSVEYRWFLSDIRVGTISEMAKTANGYEVTSSPFDSITIMLWDPGARDPSYSSVTLLAGTIKSRSIWIEDIRNAASASITIKSRLNHSPQEIVSKINSPNQTKFWTEKYRLIDICWHERISISKRQLRFFFRFSLSAYILRKYKSSNNWQRLWVVLSDCHLFFYQNHISQQAIASLCLIGFRISEPNLRDSISKSWVIKLEKELKTCFLRIENEYFYHRWRTALSYCTFSNS